MQVVNTKVNLDVLSEALMRTWYATCPGTTPIKVTSQVMSALTQTGLVATATFGAAHQLQVGDVITITGVPETGYNGTWTVTAVPSSTTIQWSLSRLSTGAEPTSPATASGTTLCDVSLPFQVLFMAGRRAGRVVNTGACFVGTVATDNSQTIDVAASSSRTIEAPAGRKMNLDKFYLDAVNAGDGLTFILM